MQTARNLSLVDAEDQQRVRETQDQSGLLFDFDSNNSPIYLQLITIFRRQISVGTWPLNSRIPTIENLAAQFGVANGTVRQALSFLEREGLIRRMRRRGTYVIKQPVLPDPITLPRTRESLAALLQSLKQVCNSVNELTDQGKRWTSRTYSRGNLTVFLEQEQVASDLLPDDAPALARLTESPLNAMRIDQVVTVGTADTATARELNLPVNAAVALVRHQLTNDKGEIVVESEWLMRGDLLNLVENYAGPGGSE